MSGRQGPGDDADKPQEASKDQEHKSTTKTLDSSSCGGAGPSQYDRNDGGEENSAALSCSLATSPEPAGGHDQKRQSSQLVIDLSRMDNQRQSHQDQEIPLKSMGEKVDQDDPNNNNDLTDQPNASKGTSIYGFNNTNQDHSTDRRKMHMEIFSVNSGNTTCEDSSWDVSCANSTTIGQAGLLLYSREPLRLKDFKTEVRGQMDVEQFSHQAELLLDLNEVSMDGIIDAMLAKVAQNDRIKTDKLAEIREAIFIPGSSVLMARTIQGFYSVAECLDWDHHHQEVSPDGTVAATIRHDQSWLCALCNLAKVSKRHMVVARFKQPINMGENAREVRLFVLIIVPTKEKSTKDQVETGRTFATMLTDAHFRQLLLHASSQTEFKALMIAKAQQLARSQRLKNRHKYLLDPILHESVSSSSLNDQQQQQSKQMKCVGKSPMQDDSSSFVTSLAINADGQKLATGDGAGESSAKFQRNPRTSKLFELISETSTTTSNSNNKSPTGMDKKVPQVEFLNSDKFRRLEEAKDKPHRGRCAFLGQLEFGKGAWQDFTRRLRYYPSDFIDAFVGPPRTTQKTVATIWFLYFGILLPTIAFSSLNTVQTHGHMGDLRKAIIGQAIGGLVFALFGGQPLVIIMTTAPLCLYTKVIHQMCLDYGFPFPAMYAAVGLWNGLFLTIYSLFGFSKLMRWCTRSTEEIFALFIVVAFVTDAGKDMMKNFRRFYFTPACEAQNNQTTNVMIDGNQTMLMTNVMRSPGDTSMGVSSPRNSSSHAYRDIEEEIESSVCRRETSLLFVLLMLGTLWLAVTLYKFKRTPYLSAGKRDILADYALPTAVILMSLVGATIFDDIYVEKFPPLVDIHFERARVDLLPWSGLLTSMGLGFTLSLLFFMDQNISAAMVMAPQNKLKKGSAYHYDLLIVGVLNGVLSLYGLPMMHGVLPHSPLHVRSLADIEEQVEEGHLREVVVNCRETRVTGIVAHVLVLLSLLLIPYPIAYIPRAVLNGLFLYMAVTSLDGLQVFERILLLVTEQSKYPPNHYIRRCPQRKIHQFTMLQLVQLIVMCLFGFSPINIVEMFFPVFILLMIPFRHKIVPKYIEDKYLEALDGKH